MFSKLWNDESGVIAVEYLFLVTIVGLGLAVGYANLEGAYNMEYSELANAVLALNQGYSVNTQSGCFGSKTGSNAADSAGSVTLGTASVTGNTINVIVCGTPTINGAP
jgi:Flp pilus assembly pilin Flp